MSEHADLDPTVLKSVANMKMPFGKYSGRPLIALPEAYLLWFDRKGFPEGRLGNLLRLTLEIKVNGLESLIHPLQDHSL